MTIRPDHVTTLAAIDSWLFLLFIGIATLLRLLSKAAGTKPTPTPSDESTFPEPDVITPRPAVQSSDEEQIRKFLEALGQPRTANVPPPLPPRSDVPPRPVAPVSPPRSMFPSELPKPKSARQRRAATAPTRPAGDIAPQPSRRYEPALPAISAEVPTFEVQQSSSFPTEPGRVAGSSQRSEAGESREKTAVKLLDLLRAPGGLQQAIVLREVFGSPRGLQPVEDLPGVA
jgi:hypothetical protein